MSLIAEYSTLSLSFNTLLYQCCTSSLLFFWGGDSLMSKRSKTNKSNKKRLGY